MKELVISPMNGKIRLKSRAGQGNLIHKEGQKGVKPLGKNNNQAGKKKIPGGMPWN
jgi:hypothetical protein